MHSIKISPEDHTAVVEDMHRSIAALKAFSTILDAVLIHDGGCLQSRDSGMAALIDRHIDALAEGLAALHAHERATFNQRTL